MNAKEHITHILHNAAGALIATIFISSLPFLASQINTFENFLKKDVAISLQIWIILTIVLVFIGVCVSFAIWVIQLKNNLLEKETDISKKESAIRKHDSEQRAKNNDEIARQRYQRNQRLIR